MTNEAPQPPKKRGRPLKPKPEGQVVAPPAKRGRPPKPAGDPKPPGRQGRPISLPEPWLSLAVELGNGTANTRRLIEELQTAPQTFYQWVRLERTPSRSSAAMIRMVFLAHGIEPPEFKEG